KVWTAAVALAFVGTAETLLCATAISRMHQGDRTDYDRELAAQGIGNLVCGVLGALPITGVISRSSANVEAGAKTSASSVMQAIWVFLFAALLPGLLGLVPESALAAILIYVGFRLVQLSTPRNILDFGRAVVGIYLATVIGIVAIDLLSGIILGLVLSTGALVYSLAHLDIHRVDLDDKIELHLHGAATFVSLPSFAGAFEEIPPGSELHLCFDELDYVDHACLDFIAAFQLRHEETGGSVIVEWPSLMGRYTRGGIRAARRSIPPTRSGTDDD
ncbi:MAG: SulP family inorganic anion transporter, partial [Polyangiales bacterium]